jgi:glycosyltransferase involved in cell wall biosynthesis
MISCHPKSGTRQPRFSLLIPTWNNLEFLRMCAESIRKNSTFEHQVIVHVSEGTDGTVDWLNEQRIDYTYSKTNVGVCIAMNSAFTLAKADYILYMNDDMYACPGWDAHLWNEIDSLPHHMFFLSSTMIEPTATRNTCVIAPHDFGRSPADFREEELLARFDSFDFHDWQGSTWPPNVVHRSLWEEVGGMSVEFSPGMYSDPDFSMKLWRAGVRHFKGVGKSRVYHFMSRSTGRVVKNEGRRQFLRKWGMSSSTFTGKILRRGEPFTGPLPDHDLTPPLVDRLKRLLH